MFEVAEIGAKVEKEEYEAALPQLRADLINAQFDLARADFPVLLMLYGDDRVGCNEVLNILHEWMDARFLKTSVFGRPRGEEKRQPRFWRFWRALPARGELGILAGSWVASMIAARMSGERSSAEFEHDCAHLRELDRLLVDDGALVVKFWIHLPKRELARRVKKADARRGRRSWQIEDADRRILEHYDEALPWMQRFVELTDSGESSWTIVEGSDDRHRNLKVARTLLERLSAHLAARASTRGAPETPRVRSKPAPSQGILDAVDLSASLDYDDYRERMAKLQGRLDRRVDRARADGRTSVIVFEGWDAAGKGGAIRRITGSLDAGDYHLVSIAAPTDEERAHHYLWRFWRRLPPPGEVVIFDRSWYGRVLVERVEGFASEKEWRRAYTEINDFEENLAQHGFHVLKFWLHIDREEQQRRFEEREKTPFKKYKITDEDYRNRERWDAYVAAVDEMVARTSTDCAPWHLVPANDKRFARAAILDTICKALGSR